jgi:hypothetical protein
MQAVESQEIRTAESLENETTDSLESLTAESKNLESLKIRSLALRKVWTPALREAWVWPPPPLAQGTGDLLTEGRRGEVRMEKFVLSKLMTAQI